MTENLWFDYTTSRSTVYKKTSLHFGIGYAVIRAFGLAQLAMEAAVQRELELLGTRIVDESILEKRMKLMVYLNIWTGSAYILRFVL